MMSGLNSYDYGTRQYYSVLPVWDRVDPLAEKFYHISPYAYCYDNPINFFDPDGRRGLNAVQWTGIGTMVVGSIMFVGGAIYTVATEGLGSVAGGGQLMTAGATTFRAGRTIYSVGSALAAAEGIMQQAKEKSSSSGQARSNNKPRKAPPANNGNAKPHGGKKHNSSIDSKISGVNKSGKCTDVRKNQCQVDANGNKVGNNRPDAQWNDENGVYHNVEFDNSARQSAHHKSQIEENDPNAVNEFYLLK